MIRLTLCLGLVLIGIFVLGVGAAGAADPPQPPTPTPMPTMVYTPAPTPTIGFSTNPSISVEFDATLWDYETYQIFNGMATSWIDALEEYDIIAIPFGFWLGIVIFNAGMRMVASRAKTDSND